MIKSTCFFISSSKSSKRYPVHTMISLLSPKHDFTSLIILFTTSIFSGSRGSPPIIDNPLIKFRERSFFKLSISSSVNSFPYLYDQAFWLKQPLHL
ncbi:hypothetical protein [Escherichia phage UPEC06]|nr:hypothetical protein [Escherichia phage UPEC06]